MKQLLSYLLLIPCISFALNAPETQTPSAKFQLTAEEDTCFKWFNETNKELPSTFQQLCQEDKDVFNNKLKYAQYPQEVTRSRNNYVDKFFEQVNKQHMACACDADTLKRAMLKVAQGLHSGDVEPKDELTIRMHIYANGLTDQEKATWSEQSYAQSPEAAHAVAQKFCDLVTQKLVDLKLIDDTQEARDKKNQELYAEKLARFKKQYGDKKIKINIALE